MFVLGMMARPRGEFHIAQLFQLAADSGLVQRDRKFVMEPLRQIDQPPADHPVDCRDRTLLNNIDQGLSLRIAQPRTGPGALPSSKPSGPRALNRTTQSRKI